MTASIQPPATLALPATQNTAPVAEFRCLFTHDIRKKQKKWQDGMLRFHTFNNRIMVYDLTRNFIGDTYYKESNELHEGDELNLDRGVMVEVSEPAGVTETDLSALFERKPRESPQKNAAAVPRVNQCPSVPPSSAISTVRSGSQLKHKSLNTLLGAPKGKLGKAVVPLKSPYESRKENENDWQEERRTKRQKISTRAISLTPSSPAVEELPVRKSSVPPWIETTENRSVPAKTLVKPTTSLTNSNTEACNIASDIPLPSASLQCPKKCKASLPEPPFQQMITHSHPRTPLPKGKCPIPRARPTKSPPLPVIRSSSPPVAASNRVNNVEFAIDSIKETSKKAPSLPPPAPRNLKTKSLKLSTSRNRSMLMCKSLTKQKAKFKPNPQALTKRAYNVSTENEDRFMTTPFSFDEDWISFQEEFAQRGRKVERAIGAITGPTSQMHPHASKGITSQESSEEIYGRMDQQLMPRPPKEKSSPPKRRSPSKSKPIKAKQSSTKRAQKNTQTELSKLNVSVINIQKEGDSTTTSSINRACTALQSNISSMRTPSAGKPLLKQSPHLIKINTISTPSAGDTQKATRAPILATSKPSTLLQKPIKPAADDIEDDVLLENGGHLDPSPNRSFRRVQSESDAPIPSHSGTWERRDLPFNTTVAIGTTKSNLLNKKITRKPTATRKFQRSKSLNSDAEASVKEVSPPPPAVDSDVGPWSTEAWDLFNWKPPGMKAPWKEIRQEIDDGKVGIFVDARSEKSSSPAATMDCYNGLSGQ